MKETSQPCSSHHCRSFGLYVGVNRRVRKPPDGNRIPQQSCPFRSLEHPPGRSLSCRGRRRPPFYKLLVLCDPRRYFSRIPAVSKLADRSFSSRESISDTDKHRHHVRAVAPRYQFASVYALPILILGAQVEKPGMPSCSRRSSFFPKIIRLPRFCLPHSPEPGILESHFAWSSAIRSCLVSFVLSWAALLLLPVFASRKIQFPCSQTRWIARSDLRLPLLAKNDIQEQKPSASSPKRAAAASPLIAECPSFAALFGVLLVLPYGRPQSIQLLVAVWWLRRRTRANVLGLLQAASETKVVIIRTASCFSSAAAGS